MNQRILLTAQAVCKHLAFQWNLRPGMNANQPVNGQTGTGITMAWVVLSPTAMPVYKHACTNAAVEPLPLCSQR